MAHITTLTRAYNDLHNSQANTYSYSGSFETFKESEVKVKLNNVDLTYNSSPSDNTQYSVNLTDKTIHVGGANLASGTLSIFPITDLGAPTLKAPYTAGSAITASDITNNQLQVMRKQMEFDANKLDNTGGTMTPTWYKPIRTDMSANQSFNAGLSATLSIPLNRKLVKQCHEAAAAQISMQNQLVSNKRLDFELARLKNCGELKKAGIIFHPASPYHSVCADVVVTAAGGQIIPHEHQLPQPQWTKSTSSSSSSSVEVIPSSNGTGLPTLQIGTVSEESSQESD